MTLEQIAAAFGDKVVEVSDRDINEVAAFEEDLKGAKGAMLVESSAKTA